MGEFVFNASSAVQHLSWLFRGYIRMYWQLHFYDQVLKLGRWTGFFNRIVFCVWLRFCFCTCCGDLEWFDPWTFCETLENSLSWLFVWIVLYACLFLSVVGADLLDIFGVFVFVDVFAVLWAVVLYGAMQNGRSAVQCQEYAVQCSWCAAAVLNIAVW